MIAAFLAFITVSRVRIISSAFLQLLVVQNCFCIIHENGSEPLRFWFYCGTENIRNSELMWFYCCLSSLLSNAVLCTLKNFMYLTWFYKKCNEVYCSKNESDWGLRSNLGMTVGFHGIIICGLKHLLLLLFLTLLILCVDIDANYFSAHPVVNGVPQENVCNPRIEVNIGNKGQSL